MEKRVAATVIKKPILLCFLFLFLIVPKSVFAHAQLEKATPAPDSFVEKSPNEVNLVFNERLESELYSIKIFDNQGKEVTKDQTNMTKDQKRITQSMPVLPTGVYTVSYSVLSADGHPIKGSYIFTVGKNNGLANNNYMYPSTVNSTDKTPKSIFFSVIRIFYYFSLILLSGWILWGTYHITKGSSSLGEHYKKWSSWLQIAFFIATIGMGVVILFELLNGWDINGAWSILSGTTVGISWTITFFFSLIGFIFLLKNQWFNYAWVLALLFAKAVNGHALAFGTPFITVSLDIIHLLAAAIWAGGLLFIVLNWKSQREYVQNYLLVYSKLALISILVLVATGFAITLIYLPKISYVFYSQWGILLLAKVVLVVLEILVGSILRNLLKKKAAHEKTWLTIDFSMMILIFSNSRDIHPFKSTSGK
jgi:copper transport protein